MWSFLFCRVPEGATGEVWCLRWWGVREAFHVWLFVCLSVCHLCFTFGGSLRSTAHFNTHSHVEREIDIFQNARLFSEAQTDDITLITASKIKRTAQLNHHSYMCACAMCLCTCVWVHVWQKHLKKTKQKKESRVYLVHNVIAIVMFLCMLFFSERR